MWSCWGSEGREHGGARAWRPDSTLVMERFAQISLLEPWKELDSSPTLINPEGVMFVPSTLWRPDAVPQMRLGLGQSWQMCTSQHSLGSLHFFHC